MTAMVHTRPRGASASSGKLSASDDTHNIHDPYGETAVQRAINRRAPTPVGIVVTGDNHLSAPLPRLSLQRRGERHERLRRSFSAAVDYALEHGARLFVIAGNLFDTPTPTNADHAFVAGELARLRRATIACVGISGSHDSPRRTPEQGGESAHQTYAALEGMTYFPPAASLTPRLVMLGDLRLAVVGISTNPAASRGSDPLADLAISDPDGVLRHADLGLLIVHAGIEGFAGLADDERIVSRASLEALHPLFRIVVAGHVHRFGRAHVGEREVIVPGSTERMDFGSPSGSSGFAWLEATSDGLTRVRRIAVAEQPRADVEVSTDRLFPGGIPADEVASETADAVAGESMAPVPALPVLPELPILMPNGRTPSGTHAQQDEQHRRALSGRQQVASEVFAILRQALDAVSTEETLVRLRLVGPISPEQHRRLPLREILRYGAQHSFAFELDTSGLDLVEPVSTAAGSARTVQRAAVPTGPLSPAFEVERLLQDRLARVSSTDPAAVADLHAAASILLARLRASSDREAEQ